MEAETQRSSPQHGEAPEWALFPIHNFCDRQEEAIHLHRLTLIGLQRLTRFPDLAKALDDLDRVRNPDTPDSTRVEEAERDAQLARREVESGFPLVNANFLVYLCSSLEVMARDLVAAWLANLPSSRQRDAISKIKIRLGDYELMSDEGRWEYVVELLEQELQNRAKYGVTRFEALFSAIGLDGQLDDSIRDDIYEMYQIRNSIVHRGGIADKKLINACPWLGLQLGDKVAISGADLFGRYQVSSAKYAHALKSRVHGFFSNLEGYPYIIPERLA